MKKQEIDDREGKIADLNSALSDLHQQMSDQAKLIEELKEETTVFEEESEATD